MVVTTFAIVLSQNLTAILTHIFATSDPIPVMELGFISAMVILLSIPGWMKFGSPRTAGLVTLGLTIAGAIALLVMVPNLFQKILE